MSAGGDLNLRKQGERMAFYWSLPGYSLFRELWNESSLWLTLFTTYCLHLHIAWSLLFTKVGGVIGGDTYLLTYAEKPVGGAKYKAEKHHWEQQQRRFGCVKTVMYVLFNLLSNMH